jgi:hypothetical protein
LLYAHHPQDTQSRSDADFDITLALDGLNERSVRVREYRFDKDHNSYFRPGRVLRDRPPARRVAASTAGALEAAIRDLDAGDPEAQRTALKTLEDLGPAAQSALPRILALMGQAREKTVREAAESALKCVMAAPAFSRADVERIQKLSECHPTSSREQTPEAGGRLRLTVRVAGNGLNFVVIE